MANAVESGKREGETGRREDKSTFFLLLCNVSIEANGFNDSTCEIYIAIHAVDVKATLYYEGLKMTNQT